MAGAGQLGISKFTHHESTNQHFTRSHKKREFMFDFVFCR